MPIICTIVVEETLKMFYLYSDFIDMIIDVNVINVSIVVIVR